MQGVCLKIQAGEGMDSNLISKIRHSLKNMIVYQPPQPPRPFVLGEDEYKLELPLDKLQKQNFEDDLQELEKLLRPGVQLNHPVNVNNRLVEVDPV